MPGKFQVYLETYAWQNTYQVRYSYVNKDGELQPVVQYRLNHNCEEYPIDRYHLEMIQKDMIQFFDEKFSELHLKSYKYHANTIVAEN